MSYEQVGLNGPDVGRWEKRMTGDEVGTAAEESAGKLGLRVWFDRCMLIVFLAMIVWAIVATYRFHVPFDGFQILFLALIAGVVCRPTRILAIPVVFLLFMVITLPMREAARAPIRSLVCRNHMEQIVLAMHKYHDDHGCFPPAYVADEDAQPMHSWRTLILPYLERADLYERYDFEEPWNGPNNSQLAESTDQFRCFSDRDTSYSLITGDGTAWADGRAPKLDEFTDGADQTIILVEVADSNISWLEPRDLTREEAMRGINAGLAMGISSRHPGRGLSEGQGSANVVFADGSGVRLENDFPLDELRKLLTYQGGEEVERPEDEL